MQYIEMHRRQVFQTQEELSRFLDMGGGLDRLMDRYSLRALFARRDG